MLGVGCNSVDYVYRLPASPRADSATAKLRISSHQAMCGGQMATAMAAGASLGLRAAYLGSVGNDHNGRFVISELQQRGVDISPVMTRDCPNRFAVIAVDDIKRNRKRVKYRLGKFAVFFFRLRDRSFDRRLVMRG